MRVVGLISGTSMDGIDVAAADLSLDGGTIELRPLGATSAAYADELQRGLEGALPPASASAEAVCRLDAEVGRAFAEAARGAVEELAPGAELVASHGQTLFHWVEDGRVLGSLQIGQPAWIAEATGLPVVADIRAADIAAGGQGAPLASLLDTLLLGDLSSGTRAALNLGGIANVTIVGDGVDPIAYDTGPANALIDAAVRHVTGGERSFDADGAMARGGTVRRELLDRLLADPYYAEPPPKSTGKELFHLPYLLEAVGDDEVSPEDLVATVTALSAVTVADACRAHGVREVVVSGGGASNPALLEALAAELSDVPIRQYDELGIPADAKEAYLVALIGFLTLHGLPGNVPSATGAARPVVMGSLVPGQQVLELPPPVTTAPTRLRVVGPG